MSETTAEALQETQEFSNIEQELHRRELEGMVTAVQRSQAVIEFDLTGKILNANENFLGLMGYSLSEVVGKHHRIFCDSEYIKSFEYQDFWDKLNAGEFASGEFKRFAKGDKEVWINATYNPIMDAEGKPYKVIKIASDVTEQKKIAAEVAGRVAAIDRAQAVIEFDLSGTVLTANENFLAVMGYKLDEIVGKHHRIFCEEAFTQTQEYATFWERLGNGEYYSGEYKRVGKHNKDVWIQATYNPIMGTDGKPYKVIKFASDVTAAKLKNAETEGRMTAVDRSQAVIEFELDGTVIKANDNFLATLGYVEREIVGQHHSLFCSEEYTRSEEYRDFWLRLSKGEIISGQFHRKGKFGRDVHIRASYNPIFDLNGKPVKVVKFAYDVTEAVEREARIATSTKEMTVAVKALSNTIEQIAESSTAANGHAQRTQDQAGEAANALTSSVEAIANIEQTARNITEIVRTMSDLSSETNLLAFNASIEAARAGEHGVGFSIVANEVRKLAERSSEAAQQITMLVEESTSRISRGSEVTRSVQGTFEKISDGVSQTSGSVDSIRASLKTQQQSFDEVDRLISQLNAAENA